MLYESTYNQYFLEHSWGPWKKHLYISRDGESGKFTYKYPQEYYDKYRQKGRELLAKSKGARMRGDMTRSSQLSREASPYYTKSADESADYYNEYYNTDVDKVINRSVKAAVKALNFGMDMKEKAEGYLNRFANAVADAWNSAKSSDRICVQAGKQFVSNMWNYAKNTVTAKRISSSVQNLIKGAGEAIEKGWNEAKETARKAKKQVTTTADDLGRKVRNTLRGAKARAQGAERV